MTKDSSALLARFVEELPNSQFPDAPDRKAYLDAVRRLLPRFQRVYPYLAKSGWLDSVRLKRPVDRNGNSVPWYTYAAISFLAEKSFSDLTVFEFGSGGSTLWWAGRAKAVTAVEHHLDWVNEMRSKLPENVTYIHRELEPGGDYSRTAADVGKLFDIIVIDGRDRVNCIKASMGSISPTGVVVWDNAERPRYAEGHDLLLANGFRRLNFQGFGPINGNAWLTSIFYRPDNCLGI